MNQADCVRLLQWALPRLGRRWAGYRRVRGQVCKRIRRRMGELDLDGFAAYRTRLECDAAEWEVLDGLCSITISRFGRDRGMWEALAADVLPALAALAGGEPVRCWSIGCASGEEPYTLSIAGEIAGVELEVLATDVDDSVLARARRAIYDRSTLRELPEDWIECGFEVDSDGWQVRPRHRARVEFRHADVRDPPPARSFELIACRNVVFIYFDEPTQRRIARPVLERLRLGGALVTGSHEEPPPNMGLQPWFASRGIYQRRLAER